jgi:hypothetical protein
MKKTFNREIKYFSKKVLDYFLVFFTSLVSGAAAFLGLPLPGASFIASKTSMAYTLPLKIGSYLPRKIRCAIVLYGSFSLSAISSIVMPSINFIIGNYTKNIKIVEYIRHLLNCCLVKYENICRIQETLY